IHTQLLSLVLRIIQVKQIWRSRVFLFSKYFLNPNIYYRAVFYIPYEEISDNQHRYLKTYLGMSNYLKRAHQMKEAYRYWFEESKTIVDNDLMGIKQRLYQFYELVNDSGIKEFQKAIETFKNWQKEILSSFAFDLHNGYIEGINNQ